MNKMCSYEADWDLVYNPNKRLGHLALRTENTDTQVSSEPASKKLKISPLISVAQARLIRTYIEDKMNKDNPISKSNLLDYAKALDPRTEDNVSGYDGDESDEEEGESDA